MLNEKFTIRFEIAIKSELTKLHTATLKLSKYKTHVIKQYLLE